MPSWNGFEIAPGDPKSQFEYLLNITVNRPSDVLAQKGYELLFQRPGEGVPGGSLDFAERASSWWTRRQDRRRTREELVNLINESFDKNFACVERGWLFQESIGHRLVRDLAPQGWFSIKKIDEAAFKEIARSINEIRQEIESKGNLVKPDPYRDNMTTYILSPVNLKILYERARTLAPRNDGALFSDESDEDYSFIDVDAVQDPAATRPPQPSPNSNRVKEPGPPLIGPYPRREDLPVIEESIDLVAAEDEAAPVAKTEHDDTARQGTAVTVNRPQGTIEGHPYENQSREKVSRAKKFMPDIEAKVLPSSETVFDRAVAYHHGTDKIDPQLDKAMKLYREAALDGHQGAMANLAAMEGDVDDRIIQLYNDGLKFLSQAQTDPRDTASGKKAKKCFESAAKLGDAVCQYNLATMYFFGMGIAPDIKLAAKWFVRAGQNQNEYIRMLLEANKQNATPELQFEIAEALRKGKGEIKPQPSVAREWYELARDNGHPRAQARLNALDKPSIVSMIRKIR